MTKKDDTLPEMYTDALASGLVEDEGESEDIFRTVGIEPLNRPPWDRWNFFGTQQWTPVNNGTPYMLMSQVVLDPKQLGQLIFDLDAEFADCAFHADRFVAAEIPSHVAGSFKLVSQTVGDRPQHVFTIEADAILFSAPDVNIPLSGLDVCLPGEKLVITVRNDGAVRAELRFGAIGTLWRRVVQSRG